MTDIYTEIRDLKTEVAALKRDKRPRTGTGGGTGGATSSVPHDHTTESDGGKLSGDRHDIYSAYDFFLGGTLPPVGQVLIYAKSDKKMYSMNSDGTEVALGNTPDLSAINFLVGTATGLLSGEIAVGTTPGGELGGTWASPTVDATHSGSSHAGTQAAAEATAAAALAGHVAAGDPHTGYRLESADHSHQSTGLQAGTLDHGAALTGLADDDHSAYLLASAATSRAAFATNWTDLTDGGTTTLHTHSGGGGSVATDTIFDAKGDLAVGTGADTASKLTAGANDTFLIADSTTGTGLKWGTSIAAATINALTGDTIALQATNKTYTATVPGLVNVTSTITLNRGGGGNAIAGFAYQPNINYQTAGDATFFSYGVLVNPLIANTGNVQPGAIHGFVDDTRFLVQDSGGAVALTLPDWDGFRAHTSIQRTGTSTLSVTQHSLFRAQLQAVPSGVTVVGLTGFRYENVILTGSGAVTTQIGVDIAALSGATTNIGIRTAADIHVNSGAAVRLFSDTSTTAMGSWNSTTGNLAIGGTRAYTGTVQMLTSGGTVTWSSGTPFYQFIATTATIKYATAPSGFGFASFFSHANIYINDAAVSVNPGPINVFFDGGTNTFDTATLRTLSIWTSFNSSPIFNAAGTGTGTITAVDQFYAAAPVIGAGITVTTRRGLHVLTAAPTGTLTTQVGVEIDVLSGGTNNFGIRNASNSVQTGYARFGAVTAPTNTGSGDLTAVNYFGTGYSRIGSQTAPTNTSAGDQTVSRLKVVDGAFGTGVEFSVTGDGALSGFLRVGSETAPTTTSAGALTCAVLLVGDAALTSGVEMQVTGDATHSGYLRVGSVAAPANTTAGDLSAVRGLFGTDATFPAGGLVLWLNQGSVGSDVYKLTSTATNDDPTEILIQDRVTTAQTTVTTLHTFTIPTGYSYFVSAYVVARCTGGIGGTADDGAAYIRNAVFKNAAGTAVQIGATSALMTLESSATWDVTFDVTGGQCRVRVAGAANTDIVWHLTARVWLVST